MTGGEESQSDKGLPKEDTNTIQQLNRTIKSSVAGWVGSRSCKLIPKAESDRESSL